MAGSTRVADLVDGPAVAGRRGRQGPFRLPSKLDLWAPIMKRRMASLSNRPAHGPLFRGAPGPTGPVRRPFAEEPLDRGTFRYGAGAVGLEKPDQ